MLVKKLGESGLIKNISDVDAIIEMQGVGIRYGQGAEVPVHRCHGVGDIQQRGSTEVHRSQAVEEDSSAQR
jgi:hypothetical protein